MRCYPTGVLEPVELKDMVLCPASSSGTLSPCSPAVQLTSVTVWSARHLALKLPFIASLAQSGLGAPHPSLHLCSRAQHLPLQLLQQLPGFSCLLLLSTFPSLHPYCPLSCHIHVQKSPWLLTVPKWRPTFLTRHSRPSTPTTSLPFLLQTLHSAENRIGQCSPNTPHTLCPLSFDLGDYFWGSNLHLPEPTPLCVNIIFTLPDSSWPPLFQEI